MFEARRGAKHLGVVMQKSGTIDMRRIRMYFYTCLCFLAVAGILLLYSTLDLKAQIYRSNRDIAESRFRLQAAALDERLLMYYTYLFQLSHDDDIFQIKNWAHLDVKEQIRRYKRASQQIKNLTYTISDSQAYVSYPAAGLVLADGLYRAGDYQCLPDALIDRLSATQHNVFPVYSQDAPGCISDIRLAVKLGVNPRSTGYAVLSFKTEELFSALTSLFSGEGSAFWLQDEEGNLLHIHAEGWLKDPSVLTRVTDGETAVLDGISCYGMTIPMDFGGWRIGAVLAETRLQGTALLVNRIIPLGLTALVLVFIAAMAVVRIVFRPIGQLSRIAAAGDGSSAPPRRGSLDYLFDRVHALLEENRQLSDHMKAELPFLQERYLLQLVMQPDAAQPSAEALEKLAISLPGHCFRVVIIHNGTPSVPTDEEGMFQDALCRAFWQEDLPQGVSIYQVRYHPRRFFLLISYGDEPVPGGWVTWLNERLQLYRTIFRETITSGVSETVSELSGLNHAFLTAENALEQQLLAGEGFVGQPGAEHAMLMTAYPFDIVADLCNALKSANSPLAEETLKRFEGWMRTRSVENRFVLKQVYLSIAEDIRHACRMVGMSDSAPDAYASLASADGAEEALSAFCAYYEQLLESRKQAIDMRERNLAQSIQAYIRENYAQVQSVEAVADTFMISQSHLYGLFREYVGTSPAQFIADVRVSEAARMLSTTQLSIAQIAQACGIDNTQRFFRLFKKAMGCTPNAFRNGQGARKDTAK